MPASADSDLRHRTGDKPGLLAVAVWARQGIALPALMALTAHRSVAAAIGYFQAARSPITRSLEGDAID